MSSSMRRVRLFFLLLPAIAMSAPLELELRLMSSEVLIKEPIVAVVIFHNLGTVPLTVPLANDLRTMVFEVTDDAGTASAFGWTRATHETSLGPNSERRVTLPAGGWIALEGYPLHNLHFSGDALRPGRYTLRARYKVTSSDKLDWKGELLSNPASFVVRTPSAAEDIRGMSYFGRDQGAELLDIAPTSRYAQWTRFVGLRFGFSDSWSGEAITGECSRIIRQIEEFCRRWSRSIFVPRLRVSQARCLLALGRTDEARAIVKPYLDGTQYPIEFQLLQGLGLAASPQPAHALELELSLPKTTFLRAEPILVTAILRNRASMPIRVPVSFQKRAINLSLTRLPVGVPRAMQYDPKLVKTLIDLPVHDYELLNPGALVAFLFDLQGAHLYELLYGDYRLSMTYEAFGTGSGSFSGRVVAAPVRFSVAAPTGEDLQALKAIVRATGSPGKGLYRGRGRNAALDGFPDTVYGRYAAFYKFWDSPCENAGAAQLIKRLGGSYLAPLVQLKRARCLADAGERAKARALLLPYSDGKKFPLIASEAKALKRQGSRSGISP